MTDDTPAGDPRSLWQNQKTEHLTMSPDEIRIQAHVVQLKARQSLIMSLVVGLLLAVLSTSAMLTMRYPPVRMIAGGIMALTLVIIYKAYRRMWARYRLSPDAAMAGCVEFYRRDLETQYRSLQLIWRFLVPIVIFIFLLWGGAFRPNPTLRRILPSAVLVVIMLERRREARKVNRMLARLASFAKDNS